MLKKLNDNFDSVWSNLSKEQINDVACALFDKLSKAITIIDHLKKENEEAIKKLKKCMNINEIILAMNLKDRYINKNLKFVHKEKIFQEKVEVTHNIKKLLKNIYGKLDETIAKLDKSKLINNVDGLVSQYKTSDFNKYKAILYLEDLLTYKDVLQNYSNLLNEKGNLVHRMFKIELLKDNNESVKK